jgi:hypothetical protein
MSLTSLETRAYLLSESDGFPFFDSFFNNGGKRSKSHVILSNFQKKCTIGICGNLECTIHLAADDVYSLKSTLGWVNGSCPCPSVRTRAVVKKLQEDLNSLRRRGLLLPMAVRY